MHGKLLPETTGEGGIFGLFPHSNLKLHIEKPSIYANFFTEQFHLEFILRNTMYGHEDLTTQMFTEAFTVKLKNWNQPRRLAISISLNK